MKACVGIVNFSEDNYHYKKTLKLTAQYCMTRGNLQRPHQMTLELLFTKDDCIIMSQIETSVAGLWAQKPIHGHFQELGSILSPDEELCMDHLRSRFGQAEL